MTNRTKNRHLKELSPFAKIYAEIEYKLMEANEQKLRLWLKCCDTPNHSNCWWATYHAAKMLKPLIEKELRVRAHQKKEAKKLAHLSSR